MEFAYVSMMCGGDEYLPGLETLGRSLQDTGTTVPRVVMVTEDVSADARAKLGEQGWQIRDIAPIATPIDDPLMSRFSNTYTKLRAWELDEYRKIVFLDGDTIVLRNIDDLFERPSLAAAPDFLLPDRFNSGVMMLEPSRPRLAEMLEQLPVVGSYDGGDQGFLNQIFDWYALPSAHRLPSAFNTHQFIFQFIAANPRLRESYLEQIRVVHYTVQKPWRETVLAGGSELWWGIYEKVHPEQQSRWREKLHTLQDKTFEKFVGRLVG